MIFYVYATLMICSLLGAIVAGAENQVLLSIVFFNAALGWFAAIVELDEENENEER